MTLYQLQVFVTVAKLRSFTLAAEALRVRQPSVSLIMQSLQRELDVKLFERLGNKIHLTTAGEEMLREAEAVVTKAEGIKEKMEEVKGLRKGKITVGASGIATGSFLPVAIQTFKKQHPGVEVVLGIQRSDELEKKLLAGELDIAILGRAPNSPLLVSEPYREEEIVVIAPPNHPLVRKRTVTLEHLAKEPLITYEAGTPIRTMVERRFAERGLNYTPALEVSLQMGSRDAIRNTVASGLGISFLSKCHIVSDVKAGRLKVLNVPDLRLKRSMYIAIHKKRQSSSLVQAFIDFLKHYEN